MKTPNTTTRPSRPLASARRLAAIAATTAALAIPSIQAETFTQGRASADSTFNWMGSIWGPADALAAPSAGNHYISDGSLFTELRTGSAGSGISFSGNSLTLRNGVVFLFKRNSTANFIAESDSIFSAGSGKIINGTILVAAGQRTFMKAQGNAFGLNATLSGSGNISVVGSNVVTLSGSAAGFTGTWTVEAATGADAGTLLLGASDRIADTSALVLNGGTFNTGGFSETLGTLKLSANSNIDLGSGDSSLWFGDSSAVLWGESVSLSITNFTEGVDSIRFGSDANGLTGSQLAQISLNGGSAFIDANGFITAIPEPSTYALLLSGGVLALVIQRRVKRAASRS